MKKLISVLLAVSALALSTTAFASRNGAEIGEGTPVFRPGDSIAFTVDASEKLTLISSKVGEIADDTTIQYVDESDNGSVSYTVRDLDAGDYNILVKADDKAVVTYNYTVAKFDIVAPEGGYMIGQNDTEAFYAAFAKVEGSSFADAGVKGVGFEFNGKKVLETIDVSVLDESADELEGAKVAVYGITMVGVEDASLIEADVFEVE